MEVVKGVHLVDTYANMILVTGQRAVLFDTSSEAVPKRFFDALDKLGVKPADITTVVITHVHPDHVTGLAAVKERTRAKVLAHEIEAPFIAKERVYDGPPGSHTQRHAGVKVDTVLRDGQTFDGFTVVHTPGHTRGHISLLDKEHDLLIAGDAVATSSGDGDLPPGTGIGPMKDAFNVDPRQHRESIKKLAQLEFQNLVCGHGKPIVGNASQKLRSMAAAL